MYLTISEKSSILNEIIPQWPIVQNLVKWKYITSTEDYNTCIKSTQTNTGKSTSIQEKSMVCHSKNYKKWTTNIHFTNDNKTQLHIWSKCSITCEEKYFKL